NTSHIAVMNFQDNLNSPTNNPPPLSSHNLTPIASNQWCSSIYQKFPSQPLYALPLAYELTPDGLAFSYPDVKPASTAIFAEFSKDFSAGFAGDLGKPVINGIDDWNINLSLA